VSPARQPPPPPPPTHIGWYPTPRNNEIDFHRCNSYAKLKKLKCFYNVKHNIKSGNDCLLHIAAIVAIILRFQTYRHKQTIAVGGALNVRSFGSEQQQMLKSAVSFSSGLLQDEFGSLDCNAV
jgi:hypothetical protein